MSKESENILNFKHCSNCGFKINKEIKVCPNCGKLIPRISKLKPLFFYEKVGYIGLILMIIGFILLITLMYSEEFNLIGILGVMFFILLPIISVQIAEGIHFEHITGCLMYFLAYLIAGLSFLTIGLYTLITEPSEIISLYWITVSIMLFSFSFLALYSRHIILKKQKKSQL